MRQHHEEDEDSEEVYADYTESLKQYLIQEEGYSEDQAVVSVSGVMIGVAICARHPEYGKEMHDIMMDDIKVRWGGSLTAFGLMAHGTGDERSAPEQLADEIARAVIIDPSSERTTSMESNTTTIRIERHLYLKLIKIAHKMELELEGKRRISMNEVIEELLKESE